jgi:4-oxalocrotonate tautomerase
MPIIQMNLVEGRSVAQKRAAVAAITEAVVSSLGVRPEQVRIMIHEMASEHFAVGGETAAMRVAAVKSTDLTKEDR